MVLLLGSQSKFYLPHQATGGTGTPTRQCKRLKVTPTPSSPPHLTTHTTNASVTPVSTKLISKLNDSGYSSPHLTSPLLTTPGSSKLASLLQHARPHPNSTPPLCVCGRRARRRQVAKVGPNTGRIFWSCPLRGGNTRAGCSFFVWAAEV